ncbi:hypothetical protein B0F90DRAFT_1710594 [Multifurca ochricompacta]|uniref:Secreted protein n=1 Tax=Multifurca ochricompacta TaxID=376703 RepID=A0AAD4QNB2_9AGAM|nr:hypothetical protein B0F90DRAFT_1710594 [Multifurca ochricompacta]
MLVPLGPWGHWFRTSGLILFSFSYNAQCQCSEHSHETSDCSDRSDKGHNNNPPIQHRARHPTVIQYFSEITTIRKISHKISVDNSRVLT